MFRRAITCCLAVLTLLSLVGCSTVYMKATPFYTGEYEKTDGPAEKRVNLWPLAYYRKPALSLLWPLGEVTDDHVAARPLVAVYKLDKEERQWRILWPLAQFDFETDSHHILPVFWGEDYFFIPPLVLWSRCGCIPRIRVATILGRYGRSSDSNGRRTSGASTSGRWLALTSKRIAAIPSRCGRCASDGVTATTLFC